MKTKEERIRDVLAFWFEELESRQHFEKDPDIDRQIQDRFLDLYWDVMNGRCESWRATPEGRLAEILVLDQFARNMFRNDPQSYAGDALAQRLAHEAIDTGADAELPATKRAFMYLPLVHSESPIDHEKALKLFEQLGDETFLKHAKEHKAIIDRFGRYPHRNAILGRESTDEELTFLEEHEGF